MKKIVIGLVAIVVLALGAFYVVVYPKFVIISGYVAKNVCSCVFVAGIDADKAKAEDVNFDMLSIADIDVDYENKSVTASVYGMNAKTAYYQGATGCALVNERGPEEAYRYPGNWEIKKYDSLENWFTYIDTVEYLSESQQKLLQEVVNKAFIEEEGKVKNTRAAVVLYKGQLVAEQYAPGFDKDSKLLGWSMTKSLTSTMFGMLEAEGKVSRADATGIEQWQGDDRKDITWTQLLHMSSGLRWDENYAEVSDAVNMLFNSDAIGEYAMEMPLEQEPGTFWNYSSGTSNIIATTMRDHFNSTEEYLRYPYEHLFYRIGAYSMLMETDAVGSFVGSSYSWATARDWARLGQLYLQEGEWAGKQIVNKAWVEFVQQDAPAAGGEYGGHFWLNKSGVLPDVPEDTYSMNGFHGQRVLIIPSKELVIVRLGLTYTRGDFDFNEWTKTIIDAIDNKPQTQTTKP